MSNARTAVKLLMENPLAAGLRLERIPAPHVLVIFGASGDLTHRKIVPALYRLAAARGGVFVNPALNEPFGLTLLEAAACGLPVAATRVSLPAARGAAGFKSTALGAVCLSSFAARPAPRRGYGMAHQFECPCPPKRCLGQADECANPISCDTP